MPIYILNVLLVLIFLASSGVVNAMPLSLRLDLSEGGRLSPNAISQFENYMAQQDCEIRVLTKGPKDIDINSQINSDIYFTTQPITNDQPAYLRLMKAYALDHQPLTITILVKSSTSLKNLSSVEGERLAIISQQSYLGGEQVLKLLANAGIQQAKDKVYETGNYLGAMSLLLHGDVFIAAIPGPLARKWLGHNKLSIIAESQAFTLGELFFSRSLSRKIIETCALAFSDLKQLNRRDKKMQIFPSWLEGFERR